VLLTNKTLPSWGPSTHEAAYFNCVEIDEKGGVDFGAKVFGHRDNCDRNAGGDQAILDGGRTIRLSRT
jgi:hypothetical protein